MLNKVYMSSFLLFLTIFSLLCICIFSVSSFFLGKNIYDMSQVYANNTALWYNSEKKANDFVKYGIEDSDIKDIEKIDNKIIFRVVMDENRELYVESEDKEILNMRMEYIGEWKPANLEVFDFDEE